MHNFISADSPAKHQFLCIQGRDKNLKSKYTKYCVLVIYQHNIKSDKEQITEMAFRVMLNCGNVSIDDYN